jgi:hypothetical protein
MTTVTLNIKDDSKVDDVLRFLRDIDFLEIQEPACSLPSANSGIMDFQGIDLGWTQGAMNRDEMNAR